MSSTQEFNNRENPDNQKCSNQTICIRGLHFHEFFEIESLIRYENGGSSFFEYLISLSYFTILAGNRVKRQRLIDLKLFVEVVSCFYGMIVDPRGWGLNIE